MTKAPVVVINPNSNEVVTQALRDALAGFAIPIECVTLKEGPFGIESQRDSDSVILPLVDLVRSREDAGAFVIACYSDPGIDACQEVTDKPVIGCQAAGTATALCLADLFGVIAIGEPSVLRHRKYMRRMGVLERCAGERALNLSVAETAVGERTFAKMCEVGALLIEDGADCLILGCAGMARHRRPLEAELGVPVIDPVQAAVAMSMGRLSI